MSMNEEPRHPLPPFTADTAAQKVRMAEDGWNSKNAQKVSLAYTLDSEWRNRSELLTGRKAIVAFLEAKWEKEVDYRLIKELWAFTENKIAVRFAYEWQNKEGQWLRSYGNENWEFDARGYIQKRMASINDLLISDKETKFTLQQRTRPD